MEQIYAEASNNERDQNKTRFDLEDRPFAIQKIAHRLPEGAGEARITAMQQAHSAAKRLLLGEQGCMSNDSVLQALSSFVETADRFFLGLAVDLRQTVVSIRKVL